jgi:hypothetical protein
LAVADGATVVVGAAVVVVVGTVVVVAAGTVVVVVAGTVVVVAGTVVVVVGTLVVVDAVVVVGVVVVVVVEVGAGLVVEVVGPGERVVVVDRAVEEMGSAVLVSRLRALALVVVAPRVESVLPADSFELAVGKTGVASRAAIGPRPPTALWVAASAAGFVPGRLAGSVTAAGVSPIEVAMALTTPFPTGGPAFARCLAASAASSVRARAIRTSSEAAWSRAPRLLKAACLSASRSRARSRL